MVDLKGFYGSLRTLQSLMLMHLRAFGNGGKWNLKTETKIEIEKLKMWKILNCLNNAKSFMLTDFALFILGLRETFEVFGCSFLVFK